MYRRFYGKAIRNGWLTAISSVVLIISGFNLGKNKQYAGNKAAESKKSFSEGFKNFYPSVRKYPEYTWALFTKLFINVTNAGLSMLVLFYIIRFHLSEGDIFKIMVYQSPAIMLMVAALITGICMIAFAFSKNITWVIIGNFAFNFGFGMYNAVDNALVNRILPSKENAGKDIAIMNTTVNLSSAYYCYSSMIVAKAAKVLGKEDLAREYETLSEEVREVVRDEYFSKNGRITINTQTAMILSLKS